MYGQGEWWWFEERLRREEVIGCRWLPSPEMFSGNGYEMKWSEERCLFVCGARMFG